MEKGLGKYIEILRPISCLFGGLIVLVGALFAIGREQIGSFFLQGSNIFKLFAAMLIYFFVVGSGNTINDVIDYEIDKINRPKRTIVRGAFTQRQVIYYYIYEILGILFLSIIGASFSPNPSLIPAMVAFFLVISFTYSLKIKSTGLLANLTVGFAGALGFPFGALFILDSREVLHLSEIWFLYITAFLFLFGREIGKDLEDIEGDREHGVQSIALKWGTNTARIFILGDSLAILGTLVIAMIWYDYKVMFIIFALFSVILLGIGNWACFNEIQEKKWRILASRMFLISQLFAILAHLFGFLF